MADENTYLIVGLGNPGRRYARTRHNIGFVVVERLSTRFPAGTERRRMQAHVLETRDDDRRVVLAMPETFMNDSGNAVAQLARWYKVPLDRLLVIYDELDLPFGSIRMRANGSDGGHNGMTSIIRQLGSQEFARLRVGIGRPARGTTISYVLSQFTDSERKQLPRIVDVAQEAALTWLRDGVVTAMNNFNRKDVAEAEPPSPVGSPTRDD